MQRDLLALTERLIGASTFEDAAEASLGAIIARAALACAGSGHHANARIARAMAHHRVSDGYRRLVALEASPRGPSGDGDPYLPSATVWKTVAALGRPLAIDVLAGTIEAEESGAVSAAPAARLVGDETLGRLRAREATHVLALPLFAPGRKVEGMISVEVDCPAAAGERFVWDHCRDELSLIANLASPYLESLPSRPIERAGSDPLLPVIGASMAGIVGTLKVFAAQEETILLGGPTGAGKSRLARWSHEQSRRRPARFETLDLATVPEDLQMAELFGWKRGAFTGATKDTAGCVARAEGGTLFLDEIDKLSLKAQAGLLRLLDERRYRPLGEAAGDRSADVRFIVGTNADLSATVAAGRFREDLYYRVNVLPVRVPPLAERRDEIPRWAEHLLQRRHRGEATDGSVALTSAAEAALVAYHWPGNLRQLDNIMRRTYALALMEHGGRRRDTVIDAHHVERALAYEGGPRARSLIDLFLLTATAFVAEVERARGGTAQLDLDHADALRGFVLGTAVQRSANNKNEAFRLLGIEKMVKNRNHSKTLRRELDKVEALCRALGGRPSPFPRVDDPSPRND